MSDTVKLDTEAFIADPGAAVAAAGDYVEMTLEAAIKDPAKLFETAGKRAVKVVQVVDGGVAREFVVRLTLDATL